MIPDEILNPPDVPFPIEGMTVHPSGLPLMYDAWIGLVYFCLGRNEILDAFKEQTGMDMRSFVGRSPIEQMVDKASGYGRTVVAGFADWVTSTLWGVAGQEMTDEEFAKFERE